MKSKFILFIGLTVTSCTKDKVIVEIGTNNFDIIEVSRSSERVIIDKKFLRNELRNEKCVISFACNEYGRRDFIVTIYEITYKDRYFRFQDNKIFFSPIKTEIIEIKQQPEKCVFE